MYYIHNSEAKSDLTFIVLHGAFMNSKATNGVAVELANQYKNNKVVQFDLPAHGQSSVSSKSSVLDLAKSIGEQIKSLQEDGTISSNVVLIGWSMGGSTSMVLNLLKFEGIKAIVLLNSAPEWSSLDGLKDIPQAAFAEAFKGILSNDIKPNITEEKFNEIMEQFDDMMSSVETCYNDIEALATYNIVDRLSEITVPVLIISGDADGVATYDNQILMSEKIPQNQLVIYPTETHTLLIKHPAFVVEHISKFISSL